MFLECLVVCINFGDFLATTLPINRSHFNDFTIVTSPEDKRTQLLAKDHDCKIVTTIRHRETKLFNKSKAINDGLDNCSQRGWLCLLDADIVLPSEFYKDITCGLEREEQYARERTVYGLHRHMCISNAEWKMFQLTGQNNWPIEKMRRFSQSPAGYLQLWYAKLIKNRYPEEYPDLPSDGCRGGYHGDIAFTKQFLHCRHLPYPQVIHISTQPIEKKPTDHNGRLSPQWEENKS